MKKPLVIYGAGTVAKLAAWYFQQNNDYDLKAFSVDDAYFQAGALHNLPVIPFSRLPGLYPPHSCHIFIGLGYQKLNTVRAAACKRFIDLGYELASCVSDRALIMTDIKPGPNCFIMPGVIIEPFARIGSNCICWSGSHIAHDSNVDDNCFMAAGCVVGGKSSIGRNSFLGINSTVQNDVSIGQSCLIGAGCVVREDLPEDSMLSAQISIKSKIRASQAARFIDL